MKIDLPPNFDMNNPHKELIYCPSCKKYQHFAFNRPRMIMWCNGCGNRYHFTYMDLKPDWGKGSPIKQPVMRYGPKKGEKYGPPKYLMVYNHWKEHPEFTIALLWRFYYWDDYSYPTILRYVRCIENDLEGLEKV